MEVGRDRISILTDDLQTAMVQEKSTDRIFFIDILRVALVILVMFHHIAGNTPFYYLEPVVGIPVAFLILIFQLLNQAYFMGVLFLLSGYFTPKSYDHKGPGRFLKDRFLRLGIPLLVYMFVLNPLASIGYWLMPSSLTGITKPLTWSTYPKLIAMGPIWFVAMLLIFDFGYAGWRALRRNRGQRTDCKNALPGVGKIGLFILGLAITSYLIRIFLPLGKVLLEFPSLAYLPQYLSFFVLGILASRRNWLQAIPNYLGKCGFTVALLVTLVLFPLALSGKSLFLGEGHWQSAVYALWDSSFAVGMCLGLVMLFRNRFNISNRLGRYLSRHSYTVYIIHVPILVLLAFELRFLQLGYLLKLGLLAIISVPLCFAAAFLVRKLPLAANVL